MFSKKCVCKLNIFKIVRPLLAALSVNGLISNDQLLCMESSISSYHQNSVVLYIMIEMPMKYDTLRKT